MPFFPIIGHMLKRGHLRRLRRLVLTIMVFLFIQSSLLNLGFAIKHQTVISESFFAVSSNAWCFRLQTTKNNREMPAKYRVMSPPPFPRASKEFEWWAVPSSHVYYAMGKFENTNTSMLVAIGYLPIIILLACFELVFIWEWNHKRGGP